MIKIDVFPKILLGFKNLDKIENFAKTLSLSEKFKRAAIIIEFFSLLLITAVGYLSYAGYFPLHYGELLMCFAFIFLYLPQIVFATSSVRSMIKFLFVNLIIILAMVYTLMVIAAINVDYKIIVALYCILWIIITLISEIEVAKMTNNIIITATTVVITIISIIIGIPDIAVSNDLLLMLQGFMLIFLPFLCTALVSNLIVQAKEYWRKKYRVKKYRVKKTRDLCKFISNSKSDQN